MADRTHRLKLLLDRQLNLDSWGKPGFSPFNKVLLFLILASIGLFTLETEPGIEGAWLDAIDIVNQLILCVFGIEFLLRLWASGETQGVKGLAGRSRYAGRFWLGIDFLAFGPELLLIGLLSVGVGVPISVEGLKAIRLLRLLKLARFVPAARMLVEVVQSVWRQLVTSFVASATLVYLAAVGVYYTESGANPENFGSISQCLWWAVVTLTTVGYGDVYPITALGKTFAGVIALIGVGIIALPSGIIAGAFMERLETDRREGTKAE